MASGQNNLQVTQPHILIVDDDPKIAQAITFLLQRETRAYDVSVASGGQAALDFLKDVMAGDAKPVDLVLLDITMPRIDGITLLRWVRKQPELMFTRIIMLTGVHDQHSIVNALSMGADDYVTKPPYLQELLARIDALLRTQQLEKRLRDQRQQLATMNDIVQRLAAALDAPALLRTAAEGIPTLFDCDWSAVYQVQPSGAVLRCHMLYQQETGIVSAENQPPIPLTAASLLGDAFRQNVAVCSDNPSEESAFDAALEAPLGQPVQTLLAVPFHWQGGDRVLGVLVAYNKRAGTFTETDAQVMQSLSSALSQSIANAWLVARLEQRSQEMKLGRNTLQAIIDGIPHPIYTIDSDWRLISINQTPMSSYQADNESAYCYERFFGRTSPCDHCQAAKTLQEGAAQTWAFSHKRNNDLPQEWEINAYPLPDSAEQGQRAVILWQDHTEERLLEQSLIQTGKLTALGQLSAGLAHEINNPLTVVRAGTDMLLETIEATEDREILDWIGAASDRATKVISNLMEYARQTSTEIEPGDLNRSVQQAINLLHYQFGVSGIEVDSDLDEALPPVAGDWDQLKGVWVNLLMNARDALLGLPENRHIRVTTRHDDTHVQVLVADNGRGVPADKINRIFDPFFTTKEPGAGPGLGLSIANRVIKQHHGDINVSSEPNVGSTFVVTLPIDRASDIV